MTTNKNIKKYFSTFQEAANWAKENPGEAIIKASDGIRFETKNSKDESIIESQKSQQEINDDEFKQLVAEMTPFGFTNAREVSSYIIKNKLGNKYKNISGVVRMSKDEHEFNFNGGFPPDIYARVCSELNLNDEGSNAKVIGFTSFKNKDNNPF